MEQWLTGTAGQVLTTLAHNWPFLLAGTVIAAVLQWKLDARRVGAIIFGLGYDVLVG